jgi:AcrR family transcriptional regulator
LAAPVNPIQRKRSRGCPRPVKSKRRMKHISPTQVAADIPARAPTRRALAKQQTRIKVLAAARRLFSEQGYEGATIRDIAAAAGMSTGAVFANFTDKSDLFREIMADDMEALMGAMRDAAGRGRNVEDAVLKIFMAGYTFYKTRLQLARAAFSVSWDRDGGPTLRGMQSSVAFQELFTEQLTAAIERGELSQEAEVKLRSQMLFDTYLSNFAQAIFDGWSLDALQARARDQIRILLAGARRG